MGGISHDEDIMHFFKRLFLSHSQPPSPCRNKDMEISCKSAEYPSKCS